MGNVDLINQRIRRSERVAPSAPKAANPLKIALAFPNTYQIGMGNLAIHRIYGGFNRHSDILIERLFLPPPDALAEMIAKNEQLRSFETGAKLNEFDVVAFSLGSELDYPNLPLMTRLGGVDFSREPFKERPALIAGGIAVTLNPEPIAEFLDAIYIGEGPFDRLLSALRARSIEALRELDNIYYPNDYTFERAEDGTIARIKIAGNRAAPVRSYDLSIVENPARTIIRAPLAVFGDMTLIETGKGCARRCRFCASSFGYAPTRHASKEAVMRAVENDVTIDKIGLVGSAVLDHPAIDEIMTHIIAKRKKLTISSVMIDRLTPRRIEALKQGGARTITVAIESASERLRRAINKNLKDSTIFETAESIASISNFNLKIYLLIGLPGERDEDIEAIRPFALELKRIFMRASKKRGTLGNIILSVDPFTPKPFTPFQWSPFEGIAPIKEKFRLIRSGLQGESNLILRFGSPKEAYISSAISMGDRSLGKLIEAKSADPRKISWSSAAREVDLDLDFFATREKSIDEIAPYSTIDARIDRADLIAEFDRSQTARNRAAREKRAQAIR